MYLKKFNLAYRAYPTNTHVNIFHLPQINVNIHVVALKALSHIHKNLSTVIYCSNLIVIC